MWVGHRVCHQFFIFWHCDSWLLTLVTLDSWPKSSMSPRMNPSQSRSATGSECESSGCCCCYRCRVVGRQRCKHGRQVVGRPWFSFVALISLPAFHFHLRSLHGLTNSQIHAAAPMIGVQSACCAACSDWVPWCSDVVSLRCLSESISVSALSVWVSDSLVALALL